MTSWTLPIRCPFPIRCLFPIRFRARPFCWWQKQNHLMSKRYTVAWLHNNTPYYSLLQSLTQYSSKVIFRTTTYYTALLRTKVLIGTTQYYSVLQNTTPYYSLLPKGNTPCSKYYTVLLRTIENYSLLQRTKKYYAVLQSIARYSVLQRTTPY